MRTLLVAEIGVNHLGSVANGKRLLDAAKRAGANAAKLQSYRADKLAAKDSPLYWESDKFISQRDFFSALDGLSYAGQAELIHYGSSIGLSTFSTPFDEEAVDFLAGLDVPWMKVASADITHTQLLRAVASTGIPTMLSTGASTVDEIRDALRVLRTENPRLDITILACPLIYPCPAAEANLGQIAALRSAFPNHSIGWSDHTQSIYTPALAVAAGARVVERHFGDKALLWADNGWGADEEEMGQIAWLIEHAETLLGDEPPAKFVTPGEHAARTYARRSLAARRDICAGEMLTIANITALRPGTGDFPANLIDGVIGAVAARDIGEGKLLTLADVTVGSR